MRQAAKVTLKWLLYNSKTSKSRISYGPQKDELCLVPDGWNDNMKEILSLLTNQLKRKIQLWKRKTKLKYERTTTTNT